MALIGLIVPVASYGYQVKLKVDNPDAVSIVLKYYNESWSTITDSYTPASEVVVSFDDNMKYPTLEVSQKSGYKITSFNNAAGEPVYGYSGTYTISLSSAIDNSEYSLTSVNLNDARTATAYVKVVGSASSIVATRGGESITLSDDAEVAVKFIPDSENKFSFRNTNYKAFYSIKVDGEPLTMTGSSIDVTVQEGTKIEIEADYPEIPVNLTINVSEGLNNVVTSVTSNYSEIAGWKLNEPFEVKAGSNIAISINTSAFQLDSISINGIKQSSSSYISFTIGTDDTTVDIVGHNFAQLNYTIKIDDPTHIDVYEGYSSTPISGLVAGENTLSISEKIASIQIKAKTGFDITSITDKDGNAVTGSNNYYTVTEGAYFDIATQERVYDGKFVVIINDLNSVPMYYDGTHKSAYWQSEEDYNARYFFESEYNEVQFATASNVRFMFTVSCDSVYNFYVNDTLQENRYNSKYVNWQGVPNNGDVFKIFTNGVVPEEHTITFTEVTDKATITVDKVKALTDWTSGVKALTGTLFEVKGVDDANLDVKVDGTKIEKDEAGVYSFKATADHSVSISNGSSGVENVEVETVADGPVYNLQGIKVLNTSTNMNELPAGIYIVNGKKVIIR